MGRGGSGGWTINYPKCIVCGISNREVGLYPMGNHYCRQCYLDIRAFVSVAPMGPVLPLAEILSGSVEILADCMHIRLQ